MFISLQDIFKSKMRTGGKVRDFNAEKKKEKFLEGRKIYLLSFLLLLLILIKCCNTGDEFCSRPWKHLMKLAHIHTHTNTMKDEERKGKKLLNYLLRGIYSSP